MFQSELELAARGERYYLVARDGSQVVGYGGLMFTLDDAHVTNIAVSPGHRRSGIATRLLAELAWEAIARDCHALTLEVRVSNTAAQALYREFGFVPAGRAQEVLREHRGRDRDVAPWPAGAVVPGVAARPQPGGRAMSALEVGESTLVLGIETSCDETAAALVMGGYDVVSSAVSTQVDLHAQFGGVVPEIAGRAHLDLLNPMIARAIVEAGVAEDRIDAVACTVGPGLIGALLVGVSAAKALALTWDVPFVGVNHMEAHLYAAFLEDPTLEFPLVVLLVSGGHTMLIEMQGHGQYRLLGQTIDDAAGEAFDKVARFLGLEYPGGPAIDREAQQGNPEAIAFPRAMLHDGLDFSFSGLKTSVMNHVRKHPDVSSADVAASFQAAVVDVLVHKAQRAAQQVGARGLVLGGGVAANSLLRERFLSACTTSGVRGFLPSRAMCTDNAAMIAAAGWHRLRSDGPTALDVGAYPNLRLSFL